MKTVSVSKRLGCKALGLILLSAYLVSASNRPSSEVPAKTLLELLSVGAPDRRLPAGAFDLVPVLAQGEPAPGREGLVVESLPETDTNSSGMTAILAELDDPATAELERLHSVLISDQQGTRLVAGLEDVPASGDLWINERGTVLFSDADRLVVAHEGGLAFTIRSGDPAPVSGSGGETLTFESFWTFSRSLNDADQVGFGALLSDGRQGLFRASRDQIVVLAMVGQMISGRPGAVLRESSLRSARFLLNDGSIVMGARAQSTSILIAGASGITAVAQSGDRIDSGLPLETLELVDADKTGRLLLVANRHHLFLWEAGLFTRIMGPDTILPGFQAGQTEFREGYVMPGGAVFFAGVVEPLAGIFLWNQEAILKVAVDGDRTPDGSSFSISVRLPGWPPYDMRQLLAFPRPASSAQAAFSSSAGSLVWRLGELLTFDLQGLSADTGTRLLLGLSPEASDAAGRILMRASECCYTQILFRAQEAEPRVTYLPYFVSGNSGLDVGSTAEAINLSAFPARVVVEPFDSEGFPLAPQRLVLPPGLNGFGFSASRLSQGFSRVTVENGASLALSNTIRVFLGEAVIGSQVTIPQQNPARQVEFLFEGTASDLALAVSNPGTAPASIAVQALDSAGAVTGQAELSVNPGRQRSAYLSGLMGSERLESPGRLLLRSEEKFLAVLLKQSGLHLAFIPPVQDPAPEAPWGFVNLFPSEVRFGGLAANSQGEMAFVSDRFDRAELWVRSGGRFIQVLPEAAFPPESAASPPYQEANVLAINEAGQALFLAALRESEDQDLFLWEETGLRKLLRIGRLEPYRPAALNDAGLVALGGPRLTFIGDAIEEVSRDGPFSSISLNQRGDLSFVRRNAVELYADREFRTVAEAQELPGAEGSDQVTFSKTAVNESRQVFFGAGWSRQRQFLGGGVFASVQGELRPLVLTGQALPGSPQWTVASVIDFVLDAQGDSIVTVNVENAQSQRTFALLRAPASAGPETLLVADPLLGIRNLYSASYDPRGGFAIFGSDEDDNLSIWAGNNQELRQVLKAGDRVPGQAASPGAFVSQIESVRLLETGEVVASLELAGAPRAGVFLGAPGLQESVIPLAAQGRFGELRYQSRALLANRGAAPASARIEFLSADGAPVGPARAIELLPGQQRSVEPEAAEPLLGWVRITSSQTLSPLLHLSVFGNSTLQTEIFLEASPLRQSGQFSSSSYVFWGQDTAAAFVNPFGRAANFELEVRASSGQDQLRQLLIPSNHQAIFLHSRDSIPPAGTLRASGAYPLPFTAVRITNGLLSTLPVR